MQIFISNLSTMTTARHLAELFLPFGTVLTSEIISDRITGLSLGIGFVTMESKCGRMAIQRLNRLHFMNAYMEVKEI